MEVAQHGAMSGLRRAGAADAEAREVAAYCGHLNGILARCGGPAGSRTDVSSYLPLSPDVVFERLRDGVLLAHVLNYHFAGAIDVARLVHGLDLAQMDREGSRVTFEVHGNLSAVLRAARDVPGLVLVNVGPHDILDMKRDLVLGLLWQVFNARLTAAISLDARPELVRLVQPGESLATLSALRPEALLVRWANYLLARDGSPRRIAALGRDLADGEVFVRVLRQVGDGAVSDADVASVLGIDVSSPLLRAEAVVSLAQRLGCHEFAAPQDIASGHPRLNFAFMATIFNRRLGISLPRQEDVDGLAERLRGADVCLVEKDGRIAALQDELTALRAERDALLLEQKAHAALVDELQAQASERERDADARVQETRAALAAEFAAGAAAALDAERTRHHDELWALLGRQQAVRDLLVGAVRALRETLCETAESGNLAPVDDSTPDGPLPLDAAGTHAAADPAGIEGAARMVVEAAAAACGRLRAADAAAAEMREVLARKERVNEVMGEKIREYTEMVIGAGDKPGKQPGAAADRRNSMLRRIFHT